MTQKNTSIKQKTNEGLAELAGAVDQDHEVQMARADLYKIARYAIDLHEMLKNVSESQGIEGWQQAKITKAADYLGSVFHALEYDLKGKGAISNAAPAMPNVGVGPGPKVGESKKNKKSMSESEVLNYKKLLEKAKLKAQKKLTNKKD